MHKLEYRIVRPIMTRVLSNTIDQITQKRKIFSRTACLGQAILSRSFRSSSINIVNHQKLRIDGLVNFLTKEELTRAAVPNTFEIKNFEISDDLKGWLSDIFLDNYLHSILTTDFFFFDSFSDYTDRLYQEKSTGKSFFCHKRDTKKSEDFLDHGLLDIESIRQSWHSFMILSTKINTAPVFMTHYSSKYDGRDYFKRRCSDLRKIYMELESEFDNFNFIDLDHESFLLKVNDNFPYHYSPDTIGNLVDIFQVACQSYGIKFDRYRYAIDT